MADSTTTLDGLHLAEGLQQGIITIEPDATELAVRPSLGDMSDDAENAWPTTDLVIRTRVASSDELQELARIAVWLHCGYAAPERDLTGGLDETHPRSWEWQVMDRDGQFRGRPQTIDLTRLHRHDPEQDYPAMIAAGDHLGGDLHLSLPTDEDGDVDEDQATETLETIQQYLDAAYEQIMVPAPSDEAIREAIRQSRGRYGRHPYAWRIELDYDPSYDPSEVNPQIDIDHDEADDDEWSQVGLYVATVHGAPTAFAAVTANGDEPELYVGEGCVEDAIREAVDVLAQRIETSERAIRVASPRSLAESISEAA